MLDARPDLERRIFRRRPTVQQTPRTGSLDVTDFTPGAARRTDAGRVRCTRIRPEGIEIDSKIEFPKPRRATVLRPGIDVHYPLDGALPSVRRELVRCTR